MNNKEITTTGGSNRSNSSLFFHQHKTKLINSLLILTFKYTNFVKNQPNIISLSYFKESLFYHLHSHTPSATLSNLFSLERTSYMCPATTSTALTVAIIHLPTSTLCTHQRLFSTFILFFLRFHLFYLRCVYCCKLRDMENREREIRRRREPRFYEFLKQLFCFVFLKFFSWTQNFVFYFHFSFSFYFL